MSCPDCTQAATIWHWGGFTDKCDGCQVRRIAGAPKHIRSGLYAATTLKSGERPTQEAVKAEYQRIQSLRAKGQR